MTPFEALQQIHAEKGYVVLNTRIVYDVSQCQLLREPTHAHSSECSNPVDIAMRVVGEATEEDYRAQAHRMDELLSLQTNYEHSYAEYPYFYKVAAAD